MTKVPVWDVPTRLFHWAFAATLAGATGIGFLADDDSPLFRFHMLLGIVAVFLLIGRILIGLFGSRHARFTAFPLGLRSIATYFPRAIFAEPQRYPGNNPGSALAAVLMFVLAPALLVTGAGLVGHEAGEIHECLAWMLVGVVGAHLVGLAINAIRHREGVAMSMITGMKQGNPEHAISSRNTAWGVVFALAAMSWSYALFTNQPSRSDFVTLPLTGAKLSLGGDEKHESGHGESRRGKHGRDHEDHDDD